MSYFEDFEEGLIGNTEYNEYAYEMENRKFNSFIHWRTRDGRILNINDMETSHIENCIKMLERKNKTKTNVYLYMKTTLLERKKNLKNESIKK